MRMLVFPSILFAAVTALALPAYAQTSDMTQHDALRDTIIALDGQLFDAFNSCDLGSFRRYLDEDVEFYQDNDDVTTTRAELEPTFIKRCTEGSGSRLRRELLPTTVEVHPIQGYGAVMFGTHRFWVIVDGEPDELASTPRFVHLWHNQGGRWRITRVISYGH